MDRSERIFVSYRWKDVQTDDVTFLQAIRTIEGRTGLKVFWDKETLRNGNWVDTLKKKIASAYVFMPIVTKEYLSFCEAGGRAGDEDYCLMEYETALLANVKIVPVFLCETGNKHTVDLKTAQQAAQRTAKGEYDENDLADLKTYLLSLNGISLGALTPAAVLDQSEKLGLYVFEHFCLSNQVFFYKEVLNWQAERLNTIRVPGFKDNGLTLDNAYIPLLFQRHLTKAEQQEKEKTKESTAPTEATEDTIFSTLSQERFAVVVSDAGQGKSSFARHAAIELGRGAQKYAISRDKFFPMYYECKSIDPSSFSRSEGFLEALAKGMEISSSALASVLRHGNPLFIFDAMDEIAPATMDRLIEAIYTHLVRKFPNVYCLFTTRPGQKLIAEGEMTLNHTPDAVVRRYTVKSFDEDQRDAFIDNLAKAKAVTEEVKKEFVEKLCEKETKVADYQTISRNPFVLLTIFADFDKGENLPDNRFDAIKSVIDKTIKKDLNKERNELLSEEDIKVILGAISYELYCQRDQGQRPHAEEDMPVQCAQVVYKLDKTYREDRVLLQAYDHFFKTSKLFDDNGFRHEFLAATYAAYYLLFLMEHPDKSDVLEIPEINVISRNTDYWKSVTEALLCLIDRTSQNSLLYLEPLLNKLQEGKTPDYATLCSAVSQFTRHQVAGADSLLLGMLRRGCEGIKSGKKIKDTFVCAHGANPYEELFYFPAIYPALQFYLSNLPVQESKDETACIHNELRKEVCALFGENYYEALRELYEERASALPSIDQRLQDAAFRIGHICFGYVRIPKNMTSIGEEAFWGCSGLTDITISDSVVTIGDRSFAGCSSLRSITLSENVNSIGYGAFAGCKKITDIFISRNVMFIGELAFVGCSGLTSLSVDKENPKYYSEGNCIIEKESNTLILGCETSEIPESVTTIDHNAFAGCSGLVTIIIPKNVISIGYNAFAGCTELKTISLFNGVKAIGECAFLNCNKLAYISLPNGITVIERDLFNGCSKLTDITIPQGVTTIGERSFADCSGLTSIIIPESVTIIESGAFKGCNGLTTLAIPANVKSIGTDPILGYGNLFSEFLEDEDYTQLCEVKESVGIMSLFPTFGAFEGCTGLTSITFEKDSQLMFIGEKSFVGCSGLRNIDIPNDVVIIEKRAFSGCSGLETIIIPPNVFSIGYGVFWGCRGLKTITIPKNVKTIEQSAFAYCSKLTAIYYQGTKAQWNGIYRPLFGTIEKTNYVVHCIDGDIAK